MNIKSFGLIYYLKKSKDENPDSLAAIYMRITVNGQRTEISMKKSIKVDNWDNTAGKVKGKKEEIRNTNEFLDKEKVKVLAIKDDLLNKGEPITSEIIKQKISWDFKS
jgi:hypothetical protein